MATELTMPQMGYDMQEGTVVRWLKDEGSNVDLGEPVAEIETDKAVVEFESYASGVLRKILVAEGSTVPVGEAIAVVGESAAAPAPAAPEPEPAPEDAAAESEADETAQEAEAVAQDAESAPEDAGLSEETGAAIPLGAASEPSAVAEADAQEAPADPEPAVPAAAPPPPARRVLATPIARQMARDAGVDLADLAGTGPGGRIVREDVAAVIESMRAAQAEAVVEEPAAESAPESAEAAVEEQPAETPEAAAEDEAVADEADEAEAVSEEEPVAEEEPAAESDDEGEVEEEPAAPEMAVEPEVADEADEGEDDDDEEPMTGEIIVSVPDEDDAEEEAEPVAAEKADDEEEAPEPVVAEEEPEADDGLLPLSRTRQQIARVTIRSKSEKPHFYVNTDVDMTAAMALRAQINEALASDGVRVTVNDMIIAASVIALKRFPKFNAYYEDGGIRLNDGVNVGIAMAVGDEGLIMPAIVGADGMSLKEIARASKDLSERSQRGALSAAEYSGGTFAVSNMGMMGVTSFVAIIQPPQTAVLAIGAVQKRPVVTDDDQIAVRQMMTATLSADHRIVDGAEGAVFVNEIKSLLENPLSVIL